MRQLQAFINKDGKKKQKRDQWEKSNRKCLKYSLNSRKKIKSSRKDRRAQEDNACFGSETMTSLENGYNPYEMLHVIQDLMAPGTAHR